MLVRDIGGVPVNRFSFIGIATLICLISNCDDLVTLASFIAPLHTGISGTFIVLMLFLVYILKKRTISIHSGEIVSIFAILMLELLGAFRGYFDIVEFSRFVAYFLFTFLVILDKGKKCDGEKISVYFLMGYIIAMLSVWGQMLGKYSFDQILKLGIRFGDVVSTGTVVQSTMRISFNQNDLGFVCAIVAVLSLILKKRFKNPAYYVTFLVSVLTCIMTMSRGAVLSLAIGLMCYFLFTSTNLTRTMRNTFIAVVGVVIVILLAESIIPNYLTGIIKRFTEENLLNGRDTIAMYYNGKLTSNVSRIFFGVGLQNYPQKYGYYMSAHNATQEIVITWGLIGLASISYLFIRGLKTARMLNYPIPREQYIPLIILIVGLQSGQGFSQYAHMLYFIVAYSTLYMGAGNAGKIKGNQYF